MFIKLYNLNKFSSRVVRFCPLPVFGPVRVSFYRSGSGQTPFLPVRTGLPVRSFLNSMSNGDHPIVMGPIFKRSWQHILKTGYANAHLLYNIITCTSVILLGGKGLKIHYFFKNWKYMLDWIFQRRFFLSEFHPTVNFFMSALNSLRRARLVKKRVLWDAKIAI